ncbi:hypothetical protein ACIHFD_04640 [Nonomuraea sp. NPDC051941]|uniref:hypothetical protein n=1 Tax=Nonomuraea sp. NPDC051941 TaxID=3364373 RepID=UPI0037CA8B1A
MHDHTWDLFSYVACGALENVEIKVAEVADAASAMSPVFRIFNIRGDGAMDRVTPTETLVTVEKERKERYSARSIYKMPADVVHRTEASSEPTVTLVLARRTGREFERALGPVDLPGYTTRREAFSCDLFTAGLRDALTQQA